MEQTGSPAKVASTAGLGPTPPLPRKKPAVFHHPMGFELYDGLAMDLHAITYAEPLFAEIAAWRERFPQYTYRPQDECVALKD